MEHSPFAHGIGGDPPAKGYGKLSTLNLTFWPWQVRKYGHLFVQFDALGPEIGIVRHFEFTSTSLSRANINS